MLSKISTAGASTIMAVAAAATFCLSAGVVTTAVLVTGSTSPNTWMAAISRARDCGAVTGPAAGCSVASVKVDPGSSLAKLLEQEARQRLLDAQRLRDEANAAATQTSSAPAASPQHSAPASAPVAPPAPQPGTQPSPNPEPSPKPHPSPSPTGDCGDSCPGD